MSSERTKNISISPTMKIAAKAIMMKRNKIDVVDLSVGEPDFQTPQHIKNAAKEAIDRDRTKYTVNEGIIELREAISHRLKEDHQLDYSPENIIVSNGAKQCIMNTILALVNKDDEVIIPAPYWVSYPEMVKFAEGRAVIVNTREEDGFKLTPQLLTDNISANTRALILCNPSNPTGAVYTREELESISNILINENIFVIADEIYEKLVYDNLQFVSTASINPQLKERTILINGVSKAYAMTGWRIGYAAGPAEIINGANKIQSHSTSNASTISQFASLEAFSGPQYEISRMRSEFEKRRNFMLYKLETVPEISCAKPGGAFYVFPNISAYFGREFKGTTIRNSYGLSYYLLREAKVAVIPGAAFGADNFIRLSYANSMKNLEEGMRRIIEALHKLKTPVRVKAKKLANFRTKTIAQVPVETNITAETRDALVAEAEAQLKYDRYFEWNANINGVIIQLRTNNGHLYDFWVENWYPAQLESDLEPHGIIYAVDEAIGREAYVFYNSETQTGFLFNVDRYYELRRLAFGMVTDISERMFNSFALRGMTGDLNGNGFALVGPKGTKKTDIFFGLLKNPQIALHSADLSFVKYGGGIAAADQPERKIYIPTNTVTVHNPLADLFDRSRCENVVTAKEDCDNQSCELNEECALDKGFPYCYFASKRSCALLDPYWIGGMQKHVKRIDLRFVFILKNERSDSSAHPLSADEALRILETGSTDSGKNQPFFNPHMLLKSTDRLQGQKKYFEKLFEIVSVFQIHTARAGIDEIINSVIETINKNGSSPE